MKAFILLVTWTMGGNLNSYQATFESYDSCSAARIALYQEEKRIYENTKSLAEKDILDRQKRNLPTGSVTITTPSLSAICVSK